MGRTSARGRANGVRQARVALGLTQAELAGAVDVTRQTVVAVESGGYAPSVYLAMAIADRLGRSVEDLFGAHHDAVAAPAADSLTTRTTTRTSQEEQR